MRESAYIKCPYYISDTKTQIRCKESRANKSTMVFGSELEATAYKHVVCKTFYKKCVTYKKFSGEEK